MEKMLRKRKLEKMKVRREGMMGKRKGIKKRKYSKKDKNLVHNINVNIHRLIHLININSNIQEYLDIKSALFPM